MGTGGGPAPPQRVPSESQAEGSVSDFPEEVGVLPGCSAEEASLTTSAGVHLDEHGPDVIRGLAEIGIGRILVRRAPEGGGREVKVTAAEEVKLSRAEHEVE
jgi:hypothetical protein